MKNYRKHNRVHSNNLIGDIPVGWYMVLKVFETLQVLSVMCESNGMSYTVVWRE